MRLWWLCRIMFARALKPNVFKLPQDHIIHHLVVRRRILLELALPCCETIAAHLLFSVHTLQAQGSILWLKLGEGGIICYIVWDVRKIYS